MNEKIPVILAGIALILSALALAEQGVPAAKKYKWHHPWFKKDIVSDTPPSWPYKIIEEKEGVILVEVTPPGAQKEPASPAPAPAQEPSKATTAAPQSSSIQQDNNPRIWYQGGTLHKATGNDWQQASQSNRLATAGDFAAAVLKGKFNSMDQLKIYANELAICITKATEDGVGGDKKVSEIAAACAIVMGWNKL